MDVEGMCGHPDSSRDRPAGDATAVQAAVWFRIGGLLRFLSHAETLRVCQRACARAGVPVKHTMGFNPHPRLSLPLPRSVGVESDDELLVLWLSVERDGMRGCVESSTGILPVGPTGVSPVEDGRLQGQDGPATHGQDAHATEGRLLTHRLSACDMSLEEFASRIGQALQRVLPAGIEVLRVKVSGAPVSFQARAASYQFRYGSNRSAEFLEALERRVRGILERTSLIVERKLPGDRRARRIDVRPFIESIQPAGEGLVVRCNVTAAGSIRVGEILQLLELKTEDLAAPIRRTGVEWAAT